MTVLSACNIPGRASSPTQRTGERSVSPVATTTLKVDHTQTEIAITTSTPIEPIQPDAPVWSVYDFTCELADGGGTMTMNLAWTDNSNREEGYRVYRNEKVIATLAPNSTFYVDVAYIAVGKTLRYSVEAFNTDWQFSTSTITPACQ